MSILLCASADAPFTTKGSTFDRFCAECGGRVMIAASGRRRLLEDPELSIMCLTCYAKRKPEEEDTFSLAATPDELSREKAEPNAWRKRN
jgi:hypothetical protein